MNREKSTIAFENKILRIIYVPLIDDGLEQIRNAKKNIFSKWTKSSMVCS